MKDKYMILDELWRDHKGKLVGASLGIVTGAAIMIFGLFATLFTVLCGAVGLFVGKQIDDNKENLYDIIDKFIPDSFKH